MKGEHTNETYTSTTATMFSKIHQTQLFQPQGLHSSTPPPPPPSYLTAGVHVTNFNPTRPESQTTSSPKTELSQNDGDSIEVVRRPRGRPPGSKNKPKPPIIVTREPDLFMSPYVLELPTGSDLVSTITNFCRRRNSGLCILNGSGAVTNVTLKQPSTTPGATVTFHGRLELLTISGTISPSIQNISNNLCISLAGPHGQIVGGIVVAPLVAASTVYIIAASFNSPAYHRLPHEQEQQNNSGGVDVASPSRASGAAAEGGGMSMYSSQNDVIWAPTPRQPPGYQ